MIDRLAELRRHAEDLIASRGQIAGILERQQLERLAQEMAARQIELERQNEALRQSQIELKATRNRYRDLFDFAPVGYMTLSHSNTIEDVNLTACGMLGLSRNQLRNDRFIRFVAPEDQERFYFHSREVLESKHKSTCEVKVITPNGGQFHARLESVPTRQGHWHMSLLDVSDRVLAEQTMRQSEERFRDLYENAPNGYFSVGADGRICMCNQRAAQLLGYGAEETVGRVVYDLYPHTPQGKEKALLIFQRYQAGETIVDEELQMEKADGTIFWVRLTMNPITDSQGRVIESRSMIVDITEHKRMQETLFAEKEILQAVMENTRTALAYLDPEFNPITVNSSYAESYGYEKEHLVGRNHLDCIPCEESAAMFRMVRDTGEPIHIHDKPIVFPHQPEKGLTYWDWTLVPIKNSQGEIIGLVQSMDETTERVMAEQGMTDYQRLLETRVSQRTRELSKAITALKRETAERRQAMKTLRESERRYRELAERSLDGFARVDIEGHIVEWNKSFKDMVERSDEEIAGARYRALTAMKWGNTERQMISRMLAEGHSPLWQTEYVRRDGTVVPIESRLYVTRDVTGKPNGMWAFMRDITERVEARQELQRTQDRLLEAQQMAHLGNWEWNLQTDRLWWSDEVFRIFGVNPGNFELTPKAFASFIHLDDHAQVNAIVATAINDGRPYDIDHRIMRPDGTTRIVHTTGDVSFGPLGEPVRLVGTVWDVTELKQTEMRMRSLSHRLLQIQEQERQMIGRELHDQLGQSLTVLSLLLARVIKISPERIGRKVEGAMEMTREIAGQIREISSQLRPRMLDDLGLLPALTWQVERINSRSPVKVTFKHSGMQRDFPADVSTAAYRVVQEGLTNVIRHAGADRAEIHAGATDDTLTIWVEDKGMGFDPQKLTNETCVGLSGMEERLGLLGGEFILESAFGHGTRITATIPLQAQPETEGHAFGKNMAVARNHANPSA